MTTFSLTPLYHSTLGFDRLFDEIERMVGHEKPQVSFPPHNIIKVNDFTYLVELALAGFTKDEIEITVEEKKLIIKGEKSKKLDDESVYLHHGIGTRNFTKTLNIADTIVVTGADFIDGILKVHLENVIPESKKPKKIMIGQPEKTTILPQKQLLSE